MRIAIDCRMIQASGIGVYLSNVLRYLLLDESVSYLLIGCQNEIEKYADIRKCNVIETDISPFSVKELLDFPVEEINRCDCFYSPNYNIPLGVKIPIVLTIHDVIFLDMPQLTSPIGYTVRYFYLKYAIQRSRLIFTVSHFSKERILHHFPRCPHIEIISNGLSSHFLRYFECEVETPKYDFPYLLYVGNIKPHKGLQCLLEAYGKLEMEGEKRRLVIVGNKDKFKTADHYVRKQIEKGVLGKNIVFTGYVTDEELISIMRHADILVQPSLYEGFGIPPLESLYVGTPVLLSDIPVFKEIYKDFPVHYFSCNDASDLCEKIRNFDTSRVELSKALKEKYSYENSACHLLEIIKKNYYENTSSR